jgi:hypothetical protein
MLWRDFACYVCEINDGIVIARIRTIIFFFETLTQLIISNIASQHPMAIITKGASSFI